MRLILLEEFSKLDYLLYIFNNFNKTNKKLLSTGEYHMEISDISKNRYFVIRTILNSAKPYKIACNEYFQEKETLYITNLRIYVEWFFVLRQPSMFVQR